MVVEPVELSAYPSLRKRLASEILGLVRALYKRAFPHSRPALEVFMTQGACISGLREVGTRSCSECLLFV
jgi:hypothetical protein